MGSICLSAAPILRCAALENHQNISLIIPTSLEVCFATTLVYFQWASGRRHLLLTAEGWMYFLLALMELLSNVVPSIKNNLSVFRAFDVGIGIASFLPLFFYTFFLYLFTTSDLTETLSTPIRKVARVAMITFIPAIVISNEVGSFVSVNLEPVDGSGLLQYVFGSKRDDTLWFFFSALSLAILLAFQASVFGFSLFRLIHTVLRRRRIGVTGQGRRTSLRGVGWISAGAKLGALETIIGFAGGGFEIALARRVIRLLARTCLYIGVVKGVDLVEDADAIRSSFYRYSGEKPRSSRKKGQSNLRALISNPRHSTFRELSPTAGTFHAALKHQDLPYDGSNLAQRPHYLTFTQRQSQSAPSTPPGLNPSAMDQFASMKEKRNAQRVTVLYDLRDGAPSLHMRFSALEIPSPAFIAEKAQHQPTDSWGIEMGARKRTTGDIESLAGSSAVLNPPSPYSRTSTLLETSQSEEFLVPKPRFFTEGGSYRSSTFSQDSKGSRGSSVPSAYEIIAIPQRTLSQRKAEAKLFLSRTPVPRTRRASNAASTSARSGGFSSPSMATTTSTRPSIDKSAPPPMIRVQSVGGSTVAVSQRLSSTSTHSPPPVPPPSFTIEVSSHNSISLQHMSDSSMSLHGMHELASQFPQTPDISRPASFNVAVTPTESTQAKPPTTFWDDSKSTVECLTPIVPGRAYGSPSEVMSSGRNGSRVSLSPSKITWRTTSPTTESSQDTDQGPAYREEPLDPFAATPSTTMRSPLANTQNAMTPTTALETAKDLRNMWAHNLSDSNSSGEDVVRTPGTGVSGFTSFSSGVVEMPEGRTVGDVGAACLGTGKSRLFKPSDESIGSKALTSPSSTSVSTFPSSESLKDDVSVQRPRSLSVNDDVKAKRISRRPDQLSSVDEAGENKPQSATKKNKLHKSQPKGLQNLHERGKSIDQLAIHWGSPSSKIPKQAVQKVTTVGAVQSKVTPRPQPPFMRLRTESVHVHPIIIPPRAEDLPLAVQDTPMESVTNISGPSQARDLMLDEDVEALDNVGALGNSTTPASFNSRTVLRDSDVLGVEDGLYLPTKPKPSNVRSPF